MHADSADRDDDSMPSKLRRLASRLRDLRHPLRELRRQRRFDNVHFSLINRCHIAKGLNSRPLGLLYALFRFPVRTDLRVICAANGRLSIRPPPLAEG